MVVLVRCAAEVEDEVKDESAASSSLLATVTMAVERMEWAERPWS
jgi:hypothetical protein